MLLTLKRFGFNDSFVNWVNTMYTDIQTCVINNGWISEMFRNTVLTGLSVHLIPPTLSLQCLNFPIHKPSVLSLFIISPEKEPKIPVKTLGIYFGHDKEECERLNWENKIEKINNLLHLWTNRVEK
jgi:hypothetical protein